MPANPSAIANLLRVARAEFRANVAFAVMAANGGQAQVLRVPSTEATGTPSERTLGEIVERASLDPEFGLARAFVRSVQLPSATLLAVAPVAGASAQAMVGVLGDDPSGFGPAQLQLLDRLAERIARHVKALQAIDQPEEHLEPPPHPGEMTGAVAANHRATVATPTHHEEPVAIEDHEGVPAGPAAVAPGERPEDTVIAAPPALTFAGFGDEPGGVIAPQGEDVYGPASPRQPLGPQTLSSTGGFLRPTLAHDPGTGPSTISRAAPWAGASSTPPPPEPPAPRSWWAPSDAVTGLPSVGQFFSRAGRLLGSEARASGAVALVLVEVPDEQTAPAAARALTAQLRFSDPLARVDRDLFAAAVLLFPGSMRGDAVEERLGSAVRSALDWLAPVRTTHVLAEPGDRRDVDELLRQAMAGLPGRTPAGSLR